MEITKPKRRDLVNFRKNDKSPVTELTIETENLTDHREWRREKDLSERRLFTRKKKTGDNLKASGTECKGGEL